MTVLRCKVCECSGRCARGSPRVTPTLHAAVCVKPATEPCASAYFGELAFRRQDLAIPVDIAPAGEFARSLDAARVSPTVRRINKLTVRWRCDSVGHTSPASECFVVAQPA